MNGTFACENDHLLNTVLKKTVRSLVPRLLEATSLAAGSLTLSPPPSLLFTYSSTTSLSRAAQLPRLGHHWCVSRLERFLSPTFLGLTPFSADWGAGHSTLSSAVNGTDYIGWAGATQHLFGEALAGYVDNGTVPIEIVDDKIIRCVVCSATSPSSCTC